MGRRGMVTIGIAVQAETFSDSNNPSPVPPNLLDPTSAFSTKSAIYLPPPKDGRPQTFRITFTYNKEKNLPEIIVNLDGEENEDKYLELKELCRGNCATTDVEEPQQDSNSKTNKKENENGVSVYHFNEIKMDYEKSVRSEEDAQNHNNFARDDGESRQEYLNHDVVGEEANGPKQRDNNVKTSSCSPKTEKIATETTQEDVGKRKKVKMNKGHRDGPSRSPDVVRTLSPTKEKSKIPVINSAACSSTTGFMPSCNYYRQKLLQDIGCTDFTSACWTPHYYNSIQKTAGQKVFKYRSRLFN